MNKHKNYLPCPIYVLFIYIWGHTNPNMSLFKWDIVYILYEYLVSLDSWFWHYTWTLLDTYVFFYSIHLAMCLLELMIPCILIYHFMLCVKLPDQTTTFFQELDKIVTTFIVPLHQLEIFYTKTQQSEGVSEKTVESKATFPINPWYVLNSAAEIGGIGRPNVSPSCNEKLY